MDPRRIRKSSANSLDRTVAFLEKRDGVDKVRYLDIDTVIFDVPCMGNKLR